MWWRSRSWSIRALLCKRSLVFTEGEDGALAAEAGGLGKRVPDEAPLQSIKMGDQGYSVDDGRGTGSSSSLTTRDALLPGVLGILHRDFIAVAVRGADEAAFAVVLIEGLFPLQVRHLHGQVVGVVLGEDRFVVGVFCAYQIVMSVIAVLEPFEVRIDDRFAVVGRIILVTRGISEGIDL